MDYNKAALEMHETHHGKVGITSKVEVKTRDVSDRVEVVVGNGSYQTVRPVIAA